MLLEGAKMHQVAAQNKGRQTILDRFFRARRRVSDSRSQLLQYRPDIKRKAGNVIIYGLRVCLISLHSLNPAKDSLPPNGEASNGWLSSNLRIRQEHGVSAPRSTV